VLIARGTSASTDGGLRWMGKCVTCDEIPCHFEPCIEHVTCD
jgi:hypothetical protein